MSADSSEKTPPATRRRRSSNGLGGIIFAFTFLFLGMACSMGYFIYRVVTHRSAPTKTESGIQPERAPAQPAPTPSTRRMPAPPQPEQP